MTECYKGWAKYEGNSKGRCCCNCRYQRPISAHPWNKNEMVKGSVSIVVGFGCTVPDLPNITFFESKHGMCEMHDWKETQ